MFIDKVRTPPGADVVSMGDFFLKTSVCHHFDTPDAKAKTATENMDSTPFFDVEALAFETGGTPIIENVTLRSSAARIGLVGRNGSGKSTLARLLGGLLKPTAGRLRIAGADPWQDRKSALNIIGFLFQNPENQIIFPTVSEEIAFGVRQQGASREAAKRTTQRTLACFGKSNWADAPVTRLSQGQKHLLCIMSVLAMRPALVIADEPFAGLDIPTRLQIARHLGKSNCRLLHVTHDLGDVAEYEEIYWLDRGRIVAQGRPDEVLPTYSKQMKLQGEHDDIADQLP